MDRRIARTETRRILNAWCVETSQAESTTDNTHVKVVRASSNVASDVTSPTPAAEIETAQWTNITETSASIADYENA